MTVLGIVVVGVLLGMFAWAGVSKIILEELNRRYITYGKVGTLYYMELQNLQSRISIKPSFLWEAVKLIRNIEKEEKAEKSRKTKKAEKAENQCGA